MASRKNPSAYMTARIEEVKKQAKLARELADENGIVEKIIRHFNYRNIEDAPVLHDHSSVEGKRHAKQLSDAEKTQCVHDYFICGSLPEVARKRKISLKDLYNMSHQSWWQVEFTNLQREATILLKVKLSRIINVTLDQLEDRVVNGEYKIDNEGKERRVPVQAQVLASITNVVFDKKKQLEEQATGIVTGETARLLGLAAALKAKAIEPEEVMNANVIDVNEGASDER